VTKEEIEEQRKLLQKIQKEIATGGETLLKLQKVKESAVYEIDSEREKLQTLLQLKSATISEEDKKIEEKRKIAETLDVQIGSHRTEIAHLETEILKKDELVKMKESNLADMEEYIKTGEQIVAQVNEQQQLLEARKNEVKKVHEEVELQQEKLRILIEHNTRQKEAAESGGTEDIDELLRSPRRTAALLGVSVSSWEAELEHKKKMEALTRKHKDLEQRDFVLRQKEEDLNILVEQITADRKDIQEQRKNLSNFDGKLKRRIERIDEKEKASDIKSKKMTKKNRS